MRVSSAGIVVLWSLAFLGCGGAPASRATTAITEDVGSDVDDDVVAADHVPAHEPEADTAREIPPLPDPATALAWWDGDQIMLREEVAFRTDKAELRSRSLPLIDAIVIALQARPTVRVEVAAHTDSDSICPHCGRRLTRDRAHSVRAALLHRGEIDPARLTARSYGDSQPRAQCDDLRGHRRARCLAQNRRVEFHVVRPPVPLTAPAISEDGAH